MAEMVSSAIVGETVNRIMSSITGKDEEKSKEKENIERLEMAHIKLEAVLQVSDRWQITEVPLLRWRSKLKRAARECDDTLLKCKQRALEDKETRQKVSQSSFPNGLPMLPSRWYHLSLDLVMIQAASLLMSEDLRGMQMVQMNS